MSESARGAWDDGRWLNRPPEVRADGTDLLVRSAPGSDLWRHTAYGFVRDSGHALLFPLPIGAAIEVTFTAHLCNLYDQAGLLARLDHQSWVKAGIELSDGSAQLGAVVTDGSSDWSLAPAPEWNGVRVTVRLSRGADHLTVRARRDGSPWRLIRVAPFSSGAASAGPYCCSPQGQGVRVRFEPPRFGDADRGVHS